MNKFKAYGYLLRCADMKLSELYDDDSELREALAVLIPDFEYPDWSHKTPHEVVQYVESQS